MSFCESDMRKLYLVRNIATECMNACKCSSYSQLVNYYCDGFYLTGHFVLYSVFVIFSKLCLCYFPHVAHIFLHIQSDMLDVRLNFVHVCNCFTIHSSHLQVALSKFLACQVMGPTQPPTVSGMGNE